MQGGAQARKGRGGGSRLQRFLPFASLSMRGGATPLCGKYDRSISPSSLYLRPFHIPVSLIPRSPLLRRVHHAGVQVGVSKWLKKLETVFYSSGMAFDKVRARRPSPT